MNLDKRRTAYLSVRGVIDRVLALLALIVLSPLLAAAALAVRIQMGSPVMFRQERVGQDGRRFSILKFRTMIVGAEAKGGGYMPPELNLIPPLGAFLRKSSLDELPQLANIVRGDIAIVGPRPALPSQFERYTPRQAERVCVPQGLTGLAQVRHRNNAPWSVRIEADLEYIERLGPIIDLKILAMTVARVLRASGVRADQTAAEVDDLGPRPPKESY